MLKKHYRLLQVENIILADKVPEQQGYQRASVVPVARSHDSNSMHVFVPVCISKYLLSCPCNMFVCLCTCMPVCLCVCVCLSVFVSI